MQLKPHDYRVRLVKSGKMIEWFQRLKPEELKNENRVKEVENNIEFYFNVHDFTLVLIFKCKDGYVAIARYDEDLKPFKMKHSFYFLSPLTVSEMNDYGTHIHFYDDKHKDFLKILQLKDIEESEQVMNFENYQA